MTERDYLLVTALQRLRAALDLFHAAQIPKDILSRVWEHHMNAKASVENLVEVLEDEVRQSRDRTESRAH